MSTNLQTESRFKYYLPGIMGFMFSFSTIMGGFAVYKGSETSHASVQMNMSVAIPTTIEVVKKESTIEVLSLPATTASPTDSAAAVPKIKVVPASDILVGSESKLKQERFIKKESTDFADSEPTEKLVSKIKNGKPVKVQATAYCINNITASGVRSKFGILAADPKYLPIGSIVRLHAAEYSGLYTVLDTGAKIKGKRIDIFLTNPKEAVYFGRRDVKVEVLRYGWNPQSSPINY